LDVSEPLTGDDASVLFISSCPIPKTEISLWCKEAMAILSFWQL